MKKMLLSIIFTTLFVELYGQLDLAVGPYYQLNLQRKNIHADAWILHNAIYSQGEYMLKWETTHNSFGSRGIRFTYSSGGGISFYADNTPSTAGTEFIPTTRFFIGNNGKIGIGTTVPAAKLHVNPEGEGGILIGKPEVSSTQLMINVSSAQNGNSYLQSIQTLGSVYGNLLLNPNGGNIGIGTTNPDNRYRLDVEGTIRASELKVCLTGGCDFVFKSDYKLMNLKTLEQFVKDNLHLPEIASEKEMVENGVNIKELQMKLLQKMEEMTLYVIDLKKENERQAKKIETLEKTVNNLISK